jgi:uncharacterized membrane protein
MTFRRLKIALVLSLLVNIFVIGAVVGGLYRWHRLADAPRLVSGGPARLRAAAAALPVDKRAAYLQALRATMRANRPLLREGRSARIDAMAALTADAYRPGDVVAALDRARAADFALRQRVERSLADAATALSVDQRRLLAEGLRRAGPLRRPTVAPADGSRDAAR